MKPLLKQVLLAATGLLFIASPVAFANDAKKLEQIQKQLTQAQKNLNQQKQAQGKVKADLQQTQSAISTEEKALSQVNKTQQGYWQELKKLQSNNQALMAKVNANKAQISRLLNAHYKNQQPDALVLLVKNSEPNQKGRQLQYIRYLQQANQQAIANLLKQQKEVETQQQKINAQLGKIKNLQNEQQKLVSQLKNKNSQVLKESQSIDKEIANQQQNISALKQQEKRLNQVIADIARKSAERARQQAAAQAKLRAEAQKRALAAAQEKKRQQQLLIQKAQQEKADKTKQLAGNDKQTITPKTPGTPKTPLNTGLTQEDLALAPDNGKAIEVANVIDDQFSRMQGKMSMPLTGPIVGRYGQAKSNGGVWKGIYIAGQGPVRAVAGGTVAHSGLLPGYGYTIIIDHGGQYLTVYTGLAGTNVSNGQQVKPQQGIGSSGQLPNEEKGVYFEVRYRGQAMNPLSWVR